MSKKNNDLISAIHIANTRDAFDILSKAGEEDLFEKAKHQIGDVHPNGKWVWTEYTGRDGNTKQEWRAIKKPKNAPAGGGSGSAAPAAKQSQSTDKPKITNNQPASNTEIDNEEYQNYYEQARKTGKEARNFALTTINSNIKKQENEYKTLIKERPGAKKAIANAKNLLIKFKSQKKALEDYEKSQSTDKQAKIRPVNTGQNGPEPKPKKTADKNIKSKPNADGKSFAVGDSVQYTRKKDGVTLKGSVVSVDKDGKYVEVRNTSGSIDYIPSGALESSKPYHSTDSKNKVLPADDKKNKQYQSFHSTQVADKALKWLNDEDEGMSFLDAFKNGRDVYNDDDKFKKDVSEKLSKLLHNYVSSQGEIDKYVKQAMGELNYFLKKGWIK